MKFKTLVTQCKMVGESLVHSQILGFKAEKSHDKACEISNYQDVGKQDHE